MSVKEAVLLEGKILAAKIQEELEKNIQNFTAKGLEQPKLIAIQAGENSSAECYINQQEKLAVKLGIEFTKIPPGKISDQKSLIRQIQEANSKYHGIFLAMPLPEKFDPYDALREIDFIKDVEGIHPMSLGLLALRWAKLIPPTAFAALKLMEYAIEQSQSQLRGKRAVLAGQSAIVGRPLQLLLGERRVTTIVCNTGTSAIELEKFVRESDIVIGCAGQPGLIKGNWIKEGAIVIDVGTTEVNGKRVGDVEFEEARKRASFITPVPGGVGPLTVTMLMQNLINAYQWQKLVRYAFNR